MLISIMLLNESNEGNNIAILDITVEAAPEPDTGDGDNGNTTQE